MYQSNPAENPDLIQDIKNFHEKFDLAPRAVNAPLDKDLMKFRIRFLAEELKEINKAAAEGNLPDLLDGIVDLVYVAIGTAYTQNMNFAEAWQRVQAANMAKEKVSSENPGKRGHSSDIVKPKGWTAPCHKDLFSEYDLTQARLSEDPELVDLPAYMAA